ncbi:MAG: hypothetical protein V3S29_00125, partial [bacterium]
MPWTKTLKLAGLVILAGVFLAGCQKEKEAPQQQAAAPTVEKVSWKMQSAFGSKLPHLGTSGPRFTDD